jgi:ABC-type polysaccharide transport system permease subunit
MSKRRKNSQINAFAILGAEFMFILLPFVVSGIVFSYKGDYSKMLGMHEWSLAASVLIGQSLVKFISGMLANRDVYTAHWERVALAISFLIVAGLVPSLIILSLVLGIFVLAVGVFFAFGAGGEALMRIKHEPTG